LLKSLIKNLGLHPDSDSAKTLDLDLVNPVPKHCLKVKTTRYLLVLLEECSFANHGNLPPLGSHGFSRGKSRRKILCQNASQLSQATESGEVFLLSQQFRRHDGKLLLYSLLLHPMSPRRKETGYRKKNAIAADLR
jgi:hypothetical protein